jgi:hypothetical protein
MNPLLRRHRARWALPALLVLMPPAAPAHDGHDHGDDPPARSAPAAGGPRFAVATEVFELVGAIDGRRVTLWLDRAQTNDPVAGATIELELGGVAVRLKADADVYVGELAAAPPPGRHPVAATVIAGAASDLLAGELVVAAPPDSAATPLRGSAATGSDGRPGTAAIAALSAALAAAIAWIAARRRGRAPTE